MIIDRQGRQFRNLRVSLTAACNYACTYCVPNGKRLQRASEELDGEELLNVTRLLVDAAGIEKIRITGGEPLISRKFEAFLRGVMAMSLQDIAITTNGQHLLKYLPLMKETGLTRLNISLDTLDPRYFREIARSGDLQTVLAGIDAALEAGIKVKVNTVPLRSSNYDQLVPLLTYCLARGIELRYIELMNMGHLKYSNQYERDFVSMDELLELVQEEYEVQPSSQSFDSTAIRYEIPKRGYFGIIANESEPFCQGCSRLRISSNGRLFGCLSNARNYDLRPLISMPHEQGINALQPILRNALGDKQALAFTGETTVMKFIGG